MQLLNILKSIIAAFFGVQSNNKLLQDDDFINKHGIKYFLILGFFLVIIFLMVLYLMVNFILNLS